MKLQTHEKQELEALVHLRDHGDTDDQRDAAALAIVELFRRMAEEREGAAETEQDARGAK